MPENGTNRNNENRKVSYEHEKYIKGYLNWIQLMDNETRKLIVKHLTD